MKSKKPTHVHKLKVKLYADGAEKDGMLALAKEPHIKGFTTNPSLMKKAGITDYTAFAKDILSRSFLTYLLQPLACILVSDSTF